MPLEKIFCFNFGGVRERQLGTEMQQTQIKTPAYAAYLNLHWLV